jgi:two-component system LytT family sensor kinase
MSNTINLRKQSFIVNLLFFFGILLFLLQPLSWQVHLPVLFWLRQMSILFLWIGLFFIISKLLVPALLIKNKLPAFFGCIIAAVIVTVVISKVIDIAIDFDELWSAAMKGIFKGFSNKTKITFNPYMLFTTSLVAAISTCIEIVKKWYSDHESRLLFEQEKIANELNFLKAQINPHFFFNTLNNIYALNRIDAEKAGDAIYTLSHMMRYVLYDTHSDTTLKKEVQFIKDYIKLMQLRLTDKVQITYLQSDQNLNHTIAPMLFLPYIENAFKHGVSPTDHTSIRVEIVATESSVTMDVHNTIVPEQGKRLLEESSGIGLVNTKRRLELIYPGRYELDINTRTPENDYFVHLKIDLK